jgi:hypothetical protein
VPGSIDADDNGIEENLEHPPGVVCCDETVCDSAGNEPSAKERAAAVEEVQSQIE